MDKYKLPDDICLDCAEVLNRAPDVIGELEDSLGEIQNSINYKSALLILKHKDEKQSVQKALVKTDPEIQELEGLEKKTQALLETWKRASTSSLAFYKSQTHQ